MKHSFFYVFLAFILFSDCNKGTLVYKDPDGKKKCRIIGADMVFNPEKKPGATYIVGSAVVNYDDKYNLKSIVSTQDTAFINYAVTYSPTQLTLKTKYYGDWIYKLDAQGRAVYVEFFNGAVKANLTYNADGYLSGLTKFDYSLYKQSTYTFNYSNGNLVKVVGTDNFGEYTETLEYTYNSDGAVDLTSNANPLYYLEITEVIPGFFGKVSKNQLISVKQSNISNKYGSGYSIFYSFLYTKDLEEKIVSMKLTYEHSEINPGIPNYSRGMWSSIYNFKYKCD